MITSNSVFSHILLALVAGRPATARLVEEDRNGSLLI